MRLNASSTFPDAGAAAVDCTIATPKGGNEAIEVEDRGNGIYRVHYTAHVAGPHKINVSFAGLTVPKTPLTVEILPGMHLC